MENRLETVTVNGKTTRFSYDADGNRVLAVYKTNGVETTRTYTLFPDYEEEQPVGDTATRRVTFSANGQAVVQRRQKGDTVERFSLHTDHLGNVAAVANSAGVYVTNSYAVYEPFGAFNVQPTATNPSVTDRGFTGHRQNNTGAYDLKLIYMNARYYHPQLGRFVSPDTIVPEPVNPQSYNRYAYVQNSPLNFTDPTGHCGAETAGSGEDDSSAQNDVRECIRLRSELEELLGYSISGTWYLWQMTSMHEAGFELRNQGVPIHVLLGEGSRQYVLYRLTAYWASSDLTSLEISARVVEFALVIGADIEDIIAVLSGHVGNGVEGTSFSRVGPNSSAHLLLGRESGFNDRFGDPDSSNNQVHHTWYWIQVAYYRADLIAYMGNMIHEKAPWEDGRSSQDYDAGIWGIDVGNQLQDGQLSLRDLANKLRVDLGE